MAHPPGSYPQQPGYPMQPGMPQQPGYPMQPGQYAPMPGQPMMPGMPGQPMMPGMPGQPMMPPGVMAQPMMMPGQPYGAGYPMQGGAYPQAVPHAVAAGKKNKKDKKQDKKGKQSKQDATYHQDKWYNRYYTQLNPQEVASLQQWFTAADTDRSGEISAAELARAQWPQGCQLDAQTCDKLVRIFDQRSLNRGAISFFEFAALFKFILHLQQAFMYADINRSSALEVTELQQGLVNAGFVVDDYTVRPYLKRLTDNQAAVNFQTFATLCVQLAQARALFEKLDPTGTGQVTLTSADFLRISLQSMY